VINSIKQPGDRLLVYGDLSNASSVLFYTDMQALLVNGRISSMIWGSFYPDAPHIFLDDAHLKAMWGPTQSSKRLFMIVPPESAIHVEALLGKQHLYILRQLSDEKAAERTLYTDRPL
jgi:hypothetical protein